jgi:energy-coupling factor transporter ATP-binding protein EcfA2
MHLPYRSGIVSILSRLPNIRREAGAFATASMELLERVGPGAEAQAGTLTFGKSRFLEIARAMAMRSRIMLLDEPAVGLNPSESERLAGSLRGLRDEGIGMLLVDQDLPFVFDVCDEATVMDSGSAASLLSPVAFGSVPRFSSLGRAMRTSAASRDTSHLPGISPERIGALSFGATAAPGGFGGAMITPARFTSSDVGLTFGVFGFVAAVLGGFESLPGALAGGRLLGVVNALVGRYVSSNYQTVSGFGILLLLLAPRPQGIVGRHWEETLIPWSSGRAREKRNLPGRRGNGTGGVAFSITAVRRDGPSSSMTQTGSGQSGIRIRPAAMFRRTGITRIMARRSRKSVERRLDSDPGHNAAIRLLVCLAHRK